MVDLAEERTGIIILYTEPASTLLFGALPEELHFRWPATDVC